MVMIILQSPLDKAYPVTQTYDEHVKRAQRLGLCSRPGMTNCRGYYYGGIDYGSPKGTPVYAAHDGVTEVRYDNTGYGYHVRVKIDDILTIYAHLSAIAIGDKLQIKAGRLLGYSGGVPGEPGAGTSTGAHLHFELRVNNVPTDPAPYLQSPTTPSNPPSATNPPSSLEYVRLKRGQEYVNIRNGPGTEYTIVGRLLPEDEPRKVMDVSGPWVCVLKWRGLSLWCHWDYLEAVNAP